MRNIFKHLHGDGSHHGITDLYEEYEAALRSALDSDEEFKASWGSKKEIWSASITKHETGIDIQGCVGIDELTDLTDTLIWKAVGGNEVCDCGYDWIASVFGEDREEFDADSVFDDFVDYLEETELYSEYFYAGCTLPPDADYDQVMSAVDEMVSTADKESEEVFAAMLESVKSYINYLKETKS